MRMNIRVKVNLRAAIKPCEIILKEMTKSVGIKRSHLETKAKEKKSVFKDKDARLFAKYFLLTNKDLKKKTPKRISYLNLMFN